MVQFKQWFTQDFTEKIEIQHCESVMFTGDDKGSVVGVYLFNDGEAYSGGGTVSGAVKRSDGGLVALTGTLAGNAASVVIPAAALACPGPIGVRVTLTQGGSVTTVLKAIYSVDDNTGAAVDPGTIIPSVNDLITAINTAVASIPSDYSALLHTLAPDFSASTAYSAGDYVWYNGTLYRFTADHAAGAWAGTDATSAVVGNDLSDLKSALIPFNFTNLIGFYHANTKTMSGVTCTDIGGGRYTLAGTATANANFDIFKNGNSLPDGIIAGSTYYVTCASNLIHLYIFDYSSSTVGQRLYDNLSGNTQFTVPNNCTGLIVRLNVYPGNTVNETVFPIISKSQMADYELQELVKTINQDAIQEKGLAANVFQTCDNAPDNSLYFVSSSGGITSPEDFPFTSPGYLKTIAYSASIKMQIAYPYNYESEKPKCRWKKAGTWGSWVVLSGGGTTTITREVSEDTYNNTYNITTKPTITTDANGWLQAVDSSTEDETGKTDMTGAIMSMLTQTGYCHLGPGIFYVSGNIDLPIWSTLEGCGKNTIIRLLQSVESGYICRLKQYSTVKNICFSGGYNQGDISDGNIGGRNGIIFIGNRSGTHPDVTPTTAKVCQISNCWFEHLDSGIYGNDAGGGLQEGLLCENCYFTRCKAGINIDCWTEYCKFTNCVMFQCYYACINNGGNNVFTACTFHGVVGFVIDNSGEDKDNNAHGSAIGCTFNHIDNINHPSTAGGGVGIKILSAKTNGFIFSGCQLWYSSVYVENSPGIQMANCLFGGGTPKIETVGEYPIILDGCLFKATPTFATDVAPKKDACRLFDGTSVV